MAENKSKNNLALVLHGLVYGSVLSVGIYLVLPEAVPLSIFVMFALFNTVAHIITDAITSKISSYFWKKEWTYLFFLTIGTDQCIHTCTLVLSCQVFLEKIVGQKWLLG